MTSNSSKAIPFFVIAIASFFMAIETFTEYTITPEMIQLAGVILAPLGIGGLVNKGFEVYKATRAQTPK